LNIRETHKYKYESIEAPFKAHTIRYSRLRGERKKNQDTGERGGGVVLISFQSNKQFFIIQKMN